MDRLSAHIVFAVFSLLSPAIFLILFSFSFTHILQQSPYSLLTFFLLTSTTTTIDYFVSPGGPRVFFFFSLPATTYQVRPFLSVVPQQWESESRESEREPELSVWMCKCCLCWRFSLGSLALPFGTHLVRRRASAGHRWISAPISLHWHLCLVWSHPPPPPTPLLSSLKDFIFSLSFSFSFSPIYLSQFSLWLSSLTYLIPTFSLFLSHSFILRPTATWALSRLRFLFFFFFFFSPESTPKSALRPSHSLSCDQAAALALQQFSLSSIQQQFPPLQQHFRFLIAPLHTHLITTLSQNVGILFFQTPLSYSPLFPPFALQTCWKHSLSSRLFRAPSLAPT